MPTLSTPTDAAPGRAPVAGASLRWPRAVVVAGLSATLGTLAHLFAGGYLPSAPITVLSLVALTVVTAAALGGPASYRRLVVLVAGGQLVVHVVLTALAGHRGDRVVSLATAPDVRAGLGTDPASGGGVRRQLEVLPTGTSTDVLPSAPPAWIQHLLNDLTGANLLMTLAHLAVAALLAGALAVGEQSLWTLIALLGTPLAALHVRGALRLRRLLVRGPGLLARLADVRRVGVLVDGGWRPRTLMLTAGPTAPRAPPWC